MKNDLYVRWADFLSVVVFSNISADSRGLRMLILVILLWIYFFYIIVFCVLRFFCSLLVEILINMY